MKRISKISVFKLLKLEKFFKMSKQPFDFSFDNSPVEAHDESMNETDNTDDLLFDDREESPETSSEIEESFLSKWKNQATLPIYRSSGPGQKTELICEEVIETVVTKRKRFYIRKGFQANKNKT